MTASGSERCYEAGGRGRLDNTPQTAGADRNRKLERGTIHDIIEPKFDTLSETVGVAMAVSTLAGALLVGSSVRASLRAIVLARIGATDFTLTAPHYFRASLAEDLAVADVVRAAYGFVSLEGQVAHEPSGRRASRVAV